jgi:hypothetical protein
MPRHLRPNCSHDPRLETSGPGNGYSGKTTKLLSRGPRGWNGEQSLRRHSGPGVASCRPSLRSRAKRASRRARSPICPHVVGVRGRVRSGVPPHVVRRWYASAGVCPHRPRRCASLAEASCTHPGTRGCSRYRSDCSADACSRAPVAFAMPLHVDHALITQSPHGLGGVHDDPHGRSPAMLQAGGYISAMLEGGGPEAFGNQLS